MQLSETVRNAQANILESTIGTSPILRVYTGSPPSGPEVAATGTLLTEMTLPSDWLTAASGGVKSLSGTWQDASADASGTPGYYRIYESTGTTCHVQGPAGVGSGELQFGDDVTAGQTVTVTVFSITRGNA